MTFRYLNIAAACLLAAPFTAYAADRLDESALADFSLEQLSDIVVTSVVRQATRLADAPASIYVISAADIRRAGVTTLPDLLRLAPNLQVAQADARNYAISARGFSSTLANKMLVLIDGRSVYSPLFSGVFWDMQDLMLDDVDRVEVISGPGATIWGANAVNGVINIITRPARDTQGGLLSLDGGKRGGGAALRHGGQLASGAHYRVYGKHQRVRDTAAESGGPDGSGMGRTQAGFRVDWAQGDDLVTVSGDAYQGTLREPLDEDASSRGAHLLARMTRHLSASEQLRLQAYFDHTNRQQNNGGGDRLDTVDIEVQHGIRIGTVHNVVWGGGYRHARDRVVQGRVFQFVPTRKELHWSNLFAQNEMTVRPDLRLTLGIKFEHNNYTGMEALPNARMAWNLNKDSLLWAAASRTVRAPARFDRDLRVPPSAGLPLTIDGGPDFESETARVLEAGYRHQPMTGLSYAATAFYADYQRLRTLEPAGGISTRFLNKAAGTARGIELWGRWQATPAWRIDAGLVVQDVEIRRLPGSFDISTAVGFGSNDARRYWSLRSSHELSSNLSADLRLRYVGALPEPLVPSYNELDARLAWRPRPDLELAIVGTNLLHARHLEFRPAGVRQYNERALRLQMALRFQ